MKEIVKNGGACRFCERVFINERGKHVSYGNLAICQDCNSLIDADIPGFVIANAGVLVEKIPWKSQQEALLRLINQELASRNAIPGDGTIPQDE